MLHYMFLLMYDCQLILNQAHSRMPGFLKLLWFARLYARVCVCVCVCACVCVCVCVCVYVSVPEGTNNQWHDTV